MNMCSGENFDTVNFSSNWNCWRCRESKDNCVHLL